MLIGFVGILSHFRKHFFSAASLDSLEISHRGQERRTYALQFPRRPGGGCFLEVNRSKKKGTGLGIFPSKASLFFIKSFLKGDDSV